MPSVLVELGFLTNKEEEDFLISDAGQTYMASALFRALKDYRNSQFPVEEETVQTPKTEEDAGTEETPSEVVETEEVQISFRVQIASSPIELDNSDPIFQGHQGVEVYISLSLIHI